MLTNYVDYKKKQKTMTNKELIKLLKKYPDDAIITTSDYTGGHHPMLEVTAVIFGGKGQTPSNKICAETPHAFVNGKNLFKRDVIYLKT